MIQADISKSHRNEHPDAMTKFRNDHLSQSTRRATCVIRLVYCSLFALFLAIPRPGTAAGSADNNIDLTGLADSTMGVSQLTADGVQCGLEVQQIGETAHRAVTNAGIAVRDDSTNRMTVSAVTTRVGPDQCASAVLLGVYAKESFFSATVGWVQTGYVVLWQRSLMVATPIGQHAAAVIDATRRLSDQMLADWRAHNPPPAVAGRETLQPGNAKQEVTEATPAAPKATP
jgi:hypothetical protein